MRIQHADDVFVDPFPKVQKCLSKGRGHGSGNLVDEGRAVLAAAETAAFITGDAGDRTGWIVGEEYLAISLDEL